MKQLPIYTLLLLFLLASCDKSPAPAPTSKAEAKDSASAYGPSRMVRNVRQAKNGDILVAAFDGVRRYDGKLFTNITGEIPSPSFWDVMEDRKGHLWFATKNSGVYRHDGKAWKQFTTKDGLASNRVGFIYEDKAGNIWFATGGGVSRYDGKSFTNLTTKDGLPNNDMTTIMEDRSGKLWFGSRGDACYYDGKTFTVLKNARGKAFHNVWAMVEDRKGNIWLGGSILEEQRGDTLVVSGGIWRYDGSTFTKVTDRGASAMIQDREGNIWTTGTTAVGGVNSWTLTRYDAMSLYDAKPKFTEIMPIDQGMLCRIMQAADGSIWFGSGSGAYRWDGKRVIDFRGEDVK